MNEHAYGDLHSGHAKDNQQPSLQAAFQAPIVADSTEAISAERREQKREAREKSNLYAAWKSADATQEAANYALAGSILSGIGLLALILTLWETRKTAQASVNSAKVANAALDISRNSLELMKKALVETDRAWIKIDCTSKFVVIDQGSIRMDVAVKAINSGKSAATNVSLIINMYGGTLLAHEKTDSLFEKIKKMNRDYDFGKSLLPDESISENRSLKISHQDVSNAITTFNEVYENVTVVNRESPAITISVLYNLSGERKIRCSFAVFNFQSASGVLLELDGNPPIYREMTMGRLIRYSPADYIT